MVSDRKLDHIDLAPEAQVKKGDERFYYEPMNELDSEWYFQDNVFDGRVKGPLWVSSMTGGLELGRRINENLARVVNEFGLSMGLGSCRSLLYSDDRLEDFAMRKIIGDQPFFANLGIAQLEELKNDGGQEKIKLLVDKLEVDGLIVHINPLQEFLQPEGDPLVSKPLEVVSWLLDFADFDVIVKEVGQGMGPESLRKLLSLPLRALETSSSGGTNFALIELMRSSALQSHAYSDLSRLGHSAEEMVGFINDILQDQSNVIQCNRVILSGGVSGFLDGHYLMESVNCQAIYGQASALLRYAKESYEDLYTYVEAQMKGYELASQMLKVRKRR